MAASSLFKTLAYTACSVAASVVGSSVTGSPEGAVAGAATFSLTAESLKAGWDVIAGMCSSQAGNEVSARLAKKSFEELDRNHVLTQHVGKTLTDLLNKQSDTVPEDDRKTLAAMAGRAATWWTEQYRPALLESELADLFARPAADVPGTDTLDADTWADVLRDLQADVQRAAHEAGGFARDLASLSDETVQRLAEHLRDAFAPSLQTVIKDDAKAYQSLSLAMVGETLGLVRDLQTRGVDLAPLEQAFAGVGLTVQQAEARLQANLDELLERTRRIEATAGETLAVAKETLAAVRGVIAREQAITVRDALPKPVRDFYGRDDDLDALRGLFASSSSVLVWGAGGMGKTQLLRAYGQQRLAQGDRVRYVDLSAATSADGVKALILQAFGLTADETLATLPTTLRQMDTLLVLDDVHQAAVASTEDGRAIRTFLLALLDAPGPARVLVSHRSSVSRWPEHHLQRLQPPYDRTFFLNLLAAHGCTLAPDEESDLTELLDALGGHPLSLRLVADRAKEFRSVRALWQRWQRLRTAMALAEDVDEADADRLDSLHVSLRLSLDALPPESSPLRQFFLFAYLPAGATAALSEHLFPDDNQTPARTLYLHGLLEHDGDRYTMLAPFRAYALHHRNDDALEPLLAALRTWWAAWAAALNGAESIRAFDADWPNVAAALPTGDDAYAAALVPQVGWFAQTSPFQDEVADWLETARPACQRLGDRLGEANCLKAQGDVFQFRKDLDDALACYDQALTLYRQTGARLGEANCLQAQARVALAQGNAHAALEAFGQAEALYVAIGDAYSLAANDFYAGDAWLLLAKARYEAGDEPGAMDARASAIAGWRRALATFERLGLEHYAAMVRQKLAALGQG